MRLLVLGAIAISLNACALQRGLTPETVASLKGRRLTTMVRRAPPFLPAIPGKYRVGLGGLIAMSDAGQRLVQENAIADPAVEIARELGDSLGEHYGMRASAPVLAVVDDDPTQISQANPTVDLVLDVWTDSWSTAPFSSDEGPYRVRYRVNLRLIDAKVAHPIDGRSGAVIAEGSCACDSEDESLAVTYDQLVADHARRLKGELDTAVQFCVEDFRSRILSPAAEP